MKTFKELRTNIIIESTVEYAKSLAKIANDKKFTSIGKKDRETMMKLAKEMKKLGVSEEVELNNGCTCTDNPCTCELVSTMYDMSKEAYKRSSRN